MPRVTTPPEELVLELADLEQVARESDHLSDRSRQALERMRARNHALLRGGVTIAAAARTLDVSPRAVQKWIAAGDLVAHGTGRSTRIDALDLVDLLARLPDGRQGTSRPFTNLLRERVPAPLRRASEDLDLSPALVNAWKQTGLIRLSDEDDLPDEELEWLSGHAKIIKALWDATVKDPSIEVAAVTGSVARGDDAPTSDVDLIIDGPIRSTPEKLTRLRGELAEATGRHVDIVGLEALERSPTLARALLADARIIIDPTGTLRSRKLELGAEPSDDERSEQRAARAELLKRLQRA